MGSNSFSFFVVVWGFSMYKMKSTANRDSFTSFLSTRMAFVCIYFHKTICLSPTCFYSINVHNTYFYYTIYNNYTTFSYFNNLVILAKKLYNTSYTFNKYPLYA